MRGGLQLRHLKIKKQQHKAIKRYKEAPYTIHLFKYKSY